MEVDVFPVSFTTEDVFLICSDGLTDTMTDEDLEQFLQTDALTEAADQLVLAANNNSGTDNITVVLVKILKV